MDVGSTLARKYRLKRLLGRGGMGSVYEAENTWTKRRVAIKLLSPALAVDSHFSARFMREAQIASQLQHPNVIDVLDMGKHDDGTLFIVQEFLEGHDLAHVVDQRSSFSIAQVVSIMAPIISALGAVHRAGAVHRDVKLENVFLTRGANDRVTPKLIDFGISKITEDEKSIRMTRTGTLMGTPMYMSPEQARGEVDVDARSDLWAVGVMLFELFAKKQPIVADNYNLLIIKIVTEGAPSLRTAWPDGPDDIVQVVDKALRLNRDHRWSSADELLRALLQCESVKALGIGNEVSDGPLRDDVARSLLLDEIQRVRDAVELDALPLPPAATTPDVETSEVNFTPTVPGKKERKGQALAETVAASSLRTSYADGSAPAVTLSKGAEARSTGRTRSIAVLGAVSLLGVGGVIWWLANSKQSNNSASHAAASVTPETHAQDAGSARTQLDPPVVATSRVADAQVVAVAAGAVDAGALVVADVMSQPPAKPEAIVLDAGIPNTQPITRRVPTTRVPAVRTPSTGGHTHIRNLRRDFDSQ